MGWLRNHLRSTVELARVRPDYLAGLRAAVATIVPLLFGELHGAPGFLWTAVAGWVTTLADTGGAMSTRAIGMAWFALWGTLLVFLGAAIGDNFVLAAAVIFLCAVCAGVARVRGEGAAATGTLALVVICIAVGTPPISLTRAALRSAFFAAGCGYAMLLSLAVWAVHPFKPAREAVGAIYQALADLVRGLRELSQAGAPEEQWHHLIRTGRPRVRSALEWARGTLASIRRDRESTSRRGELLVLLASAAEYSFGTLTALTEALHAGRQVDLAPLEEIFAAVATAVPRGATPRGPAVPEVSGDGEAEVLLRDLYQQAQVALEYASLLGQRVTGPRKEPLPATWLGPPSPPSMRDVLRPDSLLLQYSLRVAVTTTAAFVFATLMGLHRVHWVTLTVVIVLQPSAGATLGRALARIGGTMLGATVAAVLGQYLHGPIALALVLFPMSILAIALKPVNYGLYALLVTPIFVLIAETTGLEQGLVRDRVVDTLVGGAFALVGAFALWRVREREQFPQHLARLFEALQRYLHAALRDGSDRAVLEARRDTGLAAANADASLQRLLGEGHSSAEAEAAMTALALARRMSGSITALRVAAAAEPGRIERAERALGALSEATVRRSLPPPDGATGEGPALWVRLERQLSLARTAVERLVAGAAR